MSEPDYTKYSLSDLRDVRERIDREKYPDRARRVDVELEARLEAVRTRASQIEAKADGKPIPGRLVVGILAILFALSGMYRQAELAISPWIIESQREAFSTIERSVDQKGQSTEDRSRAPLFWKSWEAMRQLMNPPAWYRNYAISAGAMGVVVMVFYLSGGVLILLRKPLGIPTLALACTCSIALTVIGAGIIYFGFEFPLVLLLPNLLVGTILDTALLAGITHGKEFLNLGV